MKISADAYVEKLEQLGFIFAVATHKSGELAGVYMGFPEDDTRAAQSEGTNALATADKQRAFTTQELAAAVMARRKAR